MSTVGISATRVEDQTDETVNAHIRNQTQAKVAYYARHPEQIDRRLDELDREWDVERWVEMNSSILTLVGITLGLTRNRLWLLLPLAVQGFFLQHGVQGWCPPLPGMRRLGVRTETEIQTERFALKMLRGDFMDTPDPETAVRAVQC